MVRDRVVFVKDNFVGGKEKCDVMEKGVCRGIWQYGG